jgi:hypothetical protein
VAPDGDAGEVPKRRRVGRDNGAVRGLGGGGDDELVGTSREALPADGHEEFGVGGGDIEVVAQNGHCDHDVVDERLPASTLSTLRQLDADAEFGHGDRRDGDVVLVGDQLVEVVARPLRANQERRVKK